MDDYQTLIENGDIEGVKRLLSEEWNPSDHTNHGIRLASALGHYDIVVLLMNDPRVDPSAYFNYALRHAANNGYMDIVQLLLTRKVVRDNITEHRVLAACPSIIPHLRKYKIDSLNL